MPTAVGTRADPRIAFVMATLTLAFIGSGGGAGGVGEDWPC